jgi:indole-3-glycerol phosphate synthase
MGRPLRIATPLQLLMLLLIWRLPYPHAVVLVGQAFSPLLIATRSVTQSRQRGHMPLWTSARSSGATTPAALDDPTKAPMVFSSGFSTAANLTVALTLAVQAAISTLPSFCESIDLACLCISSLYEPSSAVVSTVLQAAGAKNVQIQHLIGSSVAGCISSSSTSSANNATAATAVIPVEYEGVPAVSITLCQFPDCSLQTFHVDADDVPDDTARLPRADWNRQTGLRIPDDDCVTTFWLVPSPAFIVAVDDLLHGLAVYYPNASVAGGVASTVSSLSRARLYRYSVSDKTSCGGTNTFSSGCVGVALAGDFQIQSMTVQGAKPVGGVYQVVKGQESTISVIVLDEAATEALNESDGRDNDDDDDDDDEVKGEDENVKINMAQARAAYAKARIPKPVLAEANFLMKTLSDDDQAFMRRQLLIGLETTGWSSTARIALELARLTGGGRFAVQQVASAGMKDGSVHLRTGSAKVTPGMRLRFFVRESEFAKQEINNLWLGYRKQLLNQQFAAGATASNSQCNHFTPAACWIIPTLDRGQKFFMGKPGYESIAAARMMPGVPSISGFFANGVIAADRAGGTATVQGSASGYFLLGSKSGRPIYNPAVAARNQVAAQDQADRNAREVAAEDVRRLADETSLTATKLSDRAAPRAADGELILKRREVHSGRALTVSAVEWSVAERAAVPSSALEGFMWDKETEVDRFRERVPLANLVSQCRSSSLDPAAFKPRDFVRSIMDAAVGGAFVIVPDCKRTEPVCGTLRRRYDISALARELTQAEVPAISVNCDGVLFGGSIDDITKAREASAAAAVEQMSQDGVVVPPILASDLVLYPYQLYKLRLAGADAVNLFVGALAAKDLTYLTKIASSLQLQVLVTVTSEVQLRTVLTLGTAIDGIIVSNRELEDFSFDMSGKQAIRVLRSDALVELRAKHGNKNLPVLVEGRVGTIVSEGNSAAQYIQELKEAGACGAIIGGALAVDESRSFVESLQALLMDNS